MTPAQQWAIIKQQRGEFMFGYFDPQFAPHLHAVLTLHNRVRFPKRPDPTYRCTWISDREPGS